MIATEANVTERDGGLRRVLLKLAATGARTMIVFKANVRLKEDINLDVFPGGPRFSPNLQFTSPELGTTRWGLTVAQPETRIASGMEGVCRFQMLGVPEFEPLTKHMVVGLVFTLSQGPIVLGSGVSYVAWASQNADTQYQ